MSMANSFMLELPDFVSAKTETTPQENETYKPYYKLNMEDSTDTDRSKEDEPTFPSFDKMIEQSIGTFGWGQLVQALLVAFSSFFDSQQTFISIFTDAHPKWHCTDDSICNSNSNICQLPNSAWAWNGPSTMVSEWDLECSTSFITGLPASAYFMGSLIGGFFLATIADSSIGRKRLLFLSCLAMSVTSALTAFSTNIWVYSALRFICGVGRVPIGTCNLVLLTEKVGKEWRGRVGVMEELLFTLGFLSLPGIAYLNIGSSWRELYLWTSIPTLIYCFMIQFFVSESPRWLFMEGRYQEAIKVLKTLSPCRNNLMLSLYPLDSHVTQKTENTDPRPSSMIRKMFKKKWALQRIVALLIPGFCIGLGYFGMALGLGNLNINLYLSVTYNAALEIPSCFLTFLMIEKWSRKGSLFTLCLLSGISGIMTTVAGNGGMQMGLELVSFFCACTAYNVILIYTVELFPTCVRNFAMTAVRQTLIFGATFGPVLVASWRNNELLSYSVFGALLLFSGFFMVRLPETKGMSLADTLDEQEHNDNMVV